MYKSLMAAGISQAKAFLRHRATEDQSTLRITVDMPVRQKRPDPCRVRSALTSSELLPGCFAFPFGKKAYSLLRIHSHTLDLLQSDWSCALYGVVYSMAWAVRAF